MVDDLRLFLDERRFLEGSSNAPGHFVIEKAFVER
jgi:ferredoxin--NADP+ reductase